MRIGQTSFVVFASKLASSAFGFLATLYFANVLGAEVLGYYAIILAVAKWIKLGGDVGVSTAVTKRMSEGSEAAEYLSAGALAVAVFGVLTSGLIFLFRGFVDAYVGTDADLFVIGLVLVGLFGSIVSAALKGDHLVHVAGLLSPIQVGGRSVIQVLLVFFGFGLMGMVTGYVLGGLIVSLIGLAFLTVGIQRPGRRHFRHLFDFAKYSWLGSVRGRSFNDIDIVVLGAFVSPALVGVYSIAWSITSFLGAFGSSIRESTFPELSQADAEQRRTRVRNIVSDSLVFNGLFIIPGLFGGLILGERLLRLYGPEFTQGVAVLGLLILAMLVYDYQNQLLNALNALDRPDVSFRVNAVFIGSNLVLNVVLVVLMGWVGAAIATVVATVIGFALSFISLRRLIEVSLPVGEIVRQVVAAAAMAAVVEGLKTAIEGFAVPSEYSTVVLLGLVTLGAAVYFAILLAISPRFRATLAANAPIRIPLLS